MSASSRLGGTLEVLEDRSERQYKKNMKKHEKNMKNMTHVKKHDHKQFLGIRENLVIFTIRLSPLVRAPRI